MPTDGAEPMNQPPSPRHRDPLRRRRGRSWPLLLCSLTCLGLWMPHGPARSAKPSESPPPLYDSLGSLSYPLSGRDRRAQAYFDQGLRLYYGFNHAEAIRAFREAARLDPTCALCAWGEAMALGPNINLPMDREAGLKAWAALQEARRRSRWASAKERAMISALAQRYAADPPEDRSALDQAYSRALQALVRTYPDDMDLRTLYAEALMNLSPWQYWSGEGAVLAKPKEILAQLETVLARRPDHPGANHFYIHAIEEVQPERALAAAQRLAALMPGAGHIVHMPGHIYVRVGRYRDAITANEHALHADQVFLASRGPALGVYQLGYYPHNYDFLAFAASMIGRRSQAIAATETMRTLAPEALLTAPGLIFLQHHRTRHLQMKVRFGMWEEILAEPAPPPAQGHARGVWEYARGRALAARGDLAGARDGLERLRVLAGDPALAPQRLEFNTSGTVLGLASELLAATIADAAGDPARAEPHYRSAMVLEDGMRYGEPPEWTVPVREEFGAFLLRQNLPARAETLFREDLRRFPENGWSLDGLAASLRARGLTRQAAEVNRRFQRMWEGSEPPAWTPPLEPPPGRSRPAGGSV